MAAGNGDLPQELSGLLAGPPDSLIAAVAYSAGMPQAHAQV